MTRWSNPAKGFSTFQKRCPTPFLGLVLAWTSISFAEAREITVDVLGLFRPRSITVTVLGGASEIRMGVRTVGSAPPAPQVPGALRVAGMISRESVNITWSRGGLLKIQPKGRKGWEAPSAAFGGEAGMKGTVEIGIPDRKFRRVYEGGLTVVAGMRGLNLMMLVDVETYVQQVLLPEFTDHQFLHAAAAQAVVIRTFALGARRRHGLAEVCDTTHCQMFMGARTPLPAGYPATFSREALSLAEEAVRLTRGLVLRDGQGVRSAFFSTACNGMTASAQEIWATARGGLYANLRSHWPGVSCRHLPGSRWEQWERKMKVSEVAAAILERASRGRVTMEVTARSPSGYVTEVRCRDRKGERRMTGEQFRLAIGRAHGWDRVLSNAFFLKIQGDECQITGRGFGHGVGLCQEGAKYLAHEGRTWQAILAHYFPEASVGLP